jgi:acid phosphatase type 7
MVRTSLRATFLRATFPACLTLGCSGGSASVAVRPAGATLEPGASLRLTATAGRGTNTSPTWASSDPSVAAVSATGVVTAVAPGSATITATSNGTSGTGAITVVPPPPPGMAVLLAAGDIASCSSSGDEATAALLDELPGAVATLGDNVYPDGSARLFENCYHPTWGRHKARTRPSPGNHDYRVSGARAYYDYFGASAGPSGRGYYSYDLGTWHVVSLNSNIDMRAGSAQERWLRADLAGSTARCTLAYWHHPRFSSGTRHGSFAAAQPIWQALYDYNADLVLGGHEHNYERFAPQTPTGAADPVRGIREFVVGTGGGSHYAGHRAIATSQVFDGATFGVLRLTLGPDSYDWEFVPVPGGRFTDRGTGVCH